MRLKLGKLLSCQCYVYTEIHTFCCLSKSVMLNSPNMLHGKCFIPCVFRSPVTNLLSILPPNMI
uniref:Uncharacterized protein n=1 Tax=Piliocolobus tephrosceles TaxID=591936 RepID=A0A8C9HY69_9PRIM